MPLQRTKYFPSAIDSTLLRIIYLQFFFLAGLLKEFMALEGFRVLPQLPTRKKRFCSDSRNATTFHALEKNVF